MNSKKLDNTALNALLDKTLLDKASKPTNIRNVKAGNVKAGKIKVLCADGSIDIKASKDGTKIKLSRGSTAEIILNGKKMTLTASPYLEWEEFNF